jgi:hypothetical protein
MALNDSVALTDAGADRWSQAGVSTMDVVTTTGRADARRRWLAASAELADPDRTTAPVAELLHRLAELARAAAAARAAGVVQFAEDGGTRVSAVAGPDPASLRLLLPAVAGEARTADEHAFAVEVDLDGRVALFVPVRALLTDPGALIVIREEDSAPPSFEERELLAGFADQAALALDRSLALSIPAVPAGPDHVTIEMHDRLIQRLYAAGLKLRGAQGLADRERAADLVEEGIADLDATIEQLRRMIRAARRSA